MDGKALERFRRWAMTPSPSREPGSPESTLFRLEEQSQSAPGGRSQLREKHEHLGTEGNACLWLSGSPGGNSGLLSD